MYLFFNWVSSEWYIALLDNNKNIISSDTFKISWNESTQTIPIIDEFLSAQNISYEQIKNIICVVGPGSFTWIRTISLVVNTLAFTYWHIRLTPVNFFDLYNRYPIVKSSSKRDLFVKMNKSAIIEVISNLEFENKCSDTHIFGDTDTNRFERAINISSEIEYSEILAAIDVADKTRIAPLYIKKPNIS